MSEVSIGDFKKIDVRVGEIMQAENVQNTDKLVKLIVNIGNEERQVIAGIAKHYNAEELVGRKLLVVVNLEKKRFKGLESQGMILAAVWDDNISVIRVDEKVPVGTRIS